MEQGDVVAHIVEVQDVYKIFGPSPEEGLQAIRDGLSKEECLERTGNVVALADVSFSVRRGEIFVVMGLSGSGKSTLIRCVNRLLDVTSGQILVDGDDITRADDEQLRAIRRKKLAMVFQHFALFPHRTVAQNVEYGLKVQGVDRETRREKALEKLELVGLREWSDRYPHNLSGGMRQRVGLARALATEADILLMDEAFSALDPLIRREMQDDLLDLQKNLHKTIMFITHDLNEALKLGDRTAIMRDGQVVQIGAPEEIVANPADDYVADFIQDVDRSRVFTVGNLTRPFEAVVSEADSFQTAHESAQRLKSTVVYVLDQDRKPVGALRSDRVAQQASNGGGKLLEYADRNFPRIAKDKPLIDVFPMFNNGQPVAVVDAEGRLVGVVSEHEILASLGAHGAVPQPAGSPATKHGNADRKPVASGGGARNA